MRALTAASLERSAMFQLTRRSLAAAELRAMLTRKAKRAARVHGEDPRVTEWIDALVTRLTTSGLLDDARVAAGRVRSSRAKGESKRAIGAKLARKGLDRALVAETIVSVDGDDHADAELDAAVIWARKKGLLRKDPQKALASLARQGFAYGVAKQALARLTDDQNAS